MKLNQKKIIVILILTIQALVQCKKTTTSSSSLEGSWELKSEINGTTGNKTEYQTGNGNLIIFSKTDYQIYSNHQLIKSGNFKIVEENSIVTNIKGNRIIFDNEPEQIRTFFKVKDEALELYIDAFDGSASLYTRKSNSENLNLTN